MGEEMSSSLQFNSIYIYIYMRQILRTGEQVASFRLDSADHFTQALDL